MISGESILSKIKNMVLAVEPDATVILYGSFARGDNGNESDMDVLILLNKETVTREDEKKITRPLYDLELATNQVIFPLIKSKKIWNDIYPNTPLYINIKREGIVI
jgi:predicted nucleotidyltransferase